MKKKFFLISAVIVMGFGAFLFSCKKEETSCYCTEYSSPTSAPISSGNFYPSTWGAKGCSELATKLHLYGIEHGLNNHVFICNDNY